MGSMVCSLLWVMQDIYIYIYIYIYPQPYPEPLNAEALDDPKLWRLNPRHPKPAKLKP